MKTKALSSLLITLAAVLFLLPMTVSAEEEQEHVPFWFYSESAQAMVKGVCTDYVLLDSDTVKANEADSFIPLPSGESVSEYQFAKITKTSEKVPDSLILDIIDKTFTVTPSGGDAGTGFVVVAVYESKDVNRLVKMHIFDLAKDDEAVGMLEGSAYVKAFWWSDLNAMTPLCEAVCREFDPSSPSSDPIPGPTPGPTPSGGDDYSDDYGGGDSGGGIIDFSGGGSSEYGGGSSTINSLPSACGAMLVSSTADDGVVDILENIKLKPDGTLNTTNKNYANDERITCAIGKISTIMKTDGYYSDYCCLIADNRSTSPNKVGIKLNETYRDRIAYVFHCDRNGNLLEIQEGKEYIKQKLDGNLFSDNILSLILYPRTTCIIAFGAR